MQGVTKSWKQMSMHTHYLLYVSLFSRASGCYALVNTWRQSAFDMFVVLSDDTKDLLFNDNFFLLIFWFPSS